MKNFTKKLALLLVFAMVLGVVSPSIVAKAANDTHVVAIDFNEFTLKLKKTAAENAELETTYEYTQYVPKDTSAPDDTKAKEIKEKDWVEIDPEYVAGGIADISWFNKKKDSYAIVRMADGNGYKYYYSDKIEAQTAALKVAWVKDDAAAATTKLPAYTATQSVGNAHAGYLIFYKGTDKTVVSPSSITYRFENGHTYYAANTLDAKLSALMGKGATLLFSEVNATASSNTSWLPAETKFKYAAQKAAPTVKVGTDHIIALKAGMEYRIVNAAAPSQKSAWVSVNEAHGTVGSNNRVTVGKVLLEDLVVTGSGLTAEGWVENHKLTETALASGNVKIQVRTAATSKAVESKIYSTTVSMPAIDANIASTASIKYNVVYDKSKGVAIKNVAGVDLEYALSTTTAAIATTKWKSIKGTATKDTVVKASDISFTKNNVTTTYTYILVRKAGDSKKGIVSSNYRYIELTDANLGFVEQSIPSAVSAAAASVGTGVTLNVTTAGAVTVTVPVATVSDAAITDKTVEVTVSNMVNPNITKWDSRGSDRKYVIAVPTYENNKVKFKFTVNKGTPAGNSGDYKVKIEGLEFTFKIVVK